MSTTVTLDDKTARALDVLRVQAAARGIPLERYLELLAEKSEQVIDSVRTSPHELSGEGFRRWLDDLSAGMPPVPPIPADFSRADLYDDHD